jgi:hypothetical protein
MGGYNIVRPYLTWQSNGNGTLICLQINSHAFFAREKIYLTDFFPLSAIPYGNCEKFTLFRALLRQNLFRFSLKLKEKRPETLSLDSAKGAAFGIRQGTQSPAPHTLWFHVRQKTAALNKIYISLDKSGFQC